MKKARVKWLDIAYNNFAKSGPNAINIDQLSMQLGQSRSGFYYHFGDKEAFLEHLLSFHRGKMEAYLVEFSKIEKPIPDLINFLIRNKDVFFFSKQLYLNRATNELFNKNYIEITDLIAKDAVKLWSSVLPANPHPHQKLIDLYNLLKEGFMNRVEYDDFTWDKIKEVLLDLNKSVEFLF